MPRAWRSACLAPSRMRCCEPPLSGRFRMPGLKESVSALPGFRLAGHPTLTESRGWSEDRDVGLSTRNRGMKSRVVATITTVSALSLADRALGWVLLIAGVVLIFVVVTPVYWPRFRKDAQEVLCILLGRPRG